MQRGFSRRVRQRLALCFAQKNRMGQAAMTRTVRVTPAIALAEDEIAETFVRAPGPGGQNVNKLATAVQLRFDVARSPSLPGFQVVRFLRDFGRDLGRDFVLDIPRDAPPLATLPDDLPDARRLFVAAFFRFATCAPCLRSLAV